MKQFISIIFVGALLLSACSKNSGASTTVVKPRYHHSWYKNHVYKKKWHVGRIHFRFEKQGVKKVKMKS